METTGPTSPMRSKPYSTRGKPISANNGTSRRPNPGWRKRLEIAYKFNGEQKNVTIHEDGSIDRDGLKRRATAAMMTECWR